MNIAFAGLRHDHIYVLAAMAQSHPDFTITGWWEQDENARAVAQNTLSQQFYPSFESLLSDETVDVVAVGDYYGIRGQRIIAALKAGKHVIADKPVCTSLSELEEIESLLHEKNLKLGCMLDLRYEPAFRHMKELISQGVLGEIKTASFTGQHPLNWGVRPAWYFEDGKHGGTFNDIAIHGVDAIGFMTGSPWTKTIYARQWNAFADQAPDFKDCAQCIGELSNGANVMADVSYAAPSPAGFQTPAYWRFTFWGANGFAECRYGSLEITILQTGDKHPRIICAPPIESNCLNDLKHEIEGCDVLFNTHSVLESSRAALQLQHYANQKG